MLCYASIPRVPASELAALETAVRNHLDSFVTASEGWDRVYVQACTTGEQGVHIDRVIEFLGNHGYRPDVVGVSGDGQPQPGNPYFQCSQTGRYYPHGQLMTVPTSRRGETRRICREYFDQHYFTCRRCTRHTENENRRTTPSNEQYCTRCFADYCRTCPECERVCWEHEMEYWDDEDGDEELICRRCVHSSRGDSFEGQDKTFRRDNSFGSARRFGIELETNRGTASDQFAFDAKEDGSISGWEYVSHVLRGDEGLEEIKNFMASGHNIRVGDNCGMHLHFSVNDLDSNEKFAVAAAFLVTQQWWFRQVESHRQGNTYCRELNPDSMLLNMKTSMQRAITFDTFCNTHERYQWMNTSAVHKHGTFENRLHHATWDFATVSRWIILNLRFVRAARELVLEPTDTVVTFKAKAERALAFALAHFGESLRDVQPLELVGTESI